MGGLVLGIWLLSTETEVIKEEDSKIIKTSCTQTLLLFIS